MNTKKWIIDWFVENGNIEKEQVLDNLHKNYFAVGMIDSFQFISLISNIENEFGVTFDNEQFIDRSFSTIDGLVNIVEGLIQNGKS